MVPINKQIILAICLLLFFLISLKDDFEDIVGHKKDSAHLFYRFKYEKEPKLRWVTEEFANQWPRTITAYWAYYNASHAVGQTLDNCAVFKDNPYLNKKKTAGLFVVNYSCGVIAYFKEMPRSESLAIVKQSIVETNHIAGKDQLKYAIYDDGCHLDSSIKADAKKSISQIQDLTV